MKKNKTIILSLLFLLTLSSCDNKSNFNKITLPSFENGSLININGQQLYDFVINDATNMLVLFSVDNCASCQEAQDQLKGLANVGHFNVYEVNVTNISREQYQYIVDATTYANSAYAFPDWGMELYLPELYLFAYQGVVITFNDYFVDNILNYINLND